MTDQLLELYRAMLRIRMVEEALAERYLEQEMRCPMHLCVGQEAIAVGVCANLAVEDAVFSNHRSHGHYLAKGGDLSAMVAELYGRATGCCHGRGGSMHLIDIDAGFMGATPIVGGTIPVAVGSAWAASLKSEARISAVFFGDGCFEEGVVHESMNFAALHRLPIVFVCENNQFSVYTQLRDRQPDRPIFRIAEAHGLSARAGNGNDVEEVARLAAAAIDQARRGGGPQFLEFSTYRWREHCGPNFDDDLNYRTAAEVEQGRADCPVARAARGLLERSPSLLPVMESMKAAIAGEIAAAFAFALESPEPPSAAAEDYVYA